MMNFYEKHWTRNTQHETLTANVKLLQFMVHWKNLLKWRAVLCWRSLLAWNTVLATVKWRFLSFRYFLPSPICLLLASLFLIALLGLLSSSIVIVAFLLQTLFSSLCHSHSSFFCVLSIVSLQQFANFLQFLFLEAFFPFVSPLFSTFLDPALGAFLIPFTWLRHLQVPKYFVAFLSFRPMRRTE